MYIFKDSILRETISSPLSRVKLNIKLFYTLIQIMQSASLVETENI